MENANVKIYTPEALTESVINHQQSLFDLRTKLEKMEEEVKERLSVIEDAVGWLGDVATEEATVQVPYFLEDENSILPKRNKDGDIGYDAYSNEDVIIKAHSSAKVSLGIGVIVPHGFSIAARTRGGRWLEGLLVGDAHVDWNYRGIIHALVYNVSDKDITIKKGERPCSIDIFKTYAIDWQPIEEYLKENDLPKEDVMNTNRGTTGFGESGK